MKRTLIIAVSALGILAASCSDQLEFEPRDNQILVDDALQTKEDYQALLNSCYDVLANTFNGRSQKFSFVMGDNAAQPNANDDLTEAYNFNTLIFNGSIDDYFSEPYIAIRRCNSLLDVLTPEASAELGFTDEEANQLLNEARFIRALCYFDLVRKFAHPWGYTADNSHLGVVLRTEPTADILPRASVGEVYGFILDELNEIVETLPAGGPEYANKHAAHALLAKVYFYQNDFENAAFHAGEVINSGRYSLDLDDRYSETASPEAIFAVISTDIDRRSGELQGLFLTTNQPTLSLSRETYDLIAENDADTRNKYLVPINEGQENELLGYNRFNATFFTIPLLHLTETTLIRAEALAELGNGDEALDLLNGIMERAYGLDGLLPSASNARIIEQCRLERRLETIGEGERIYDIKRIGVLQLTDDTGYRTSVRGTDWDCPGMLLQFPADEQTQVFELNPSGGGC